MERYRAGQLTTPQKRLQAALVEETESEWQPQVRAQARQQAATSSGMMVDVTAYFGFTCTGSSRRRPRAPDHHGHLALLHEADPGAPGGRCDGGGPASDRRGGHQGVVFHRMGHPRRWSARRFHARLTNRVPVLTRAEFETC
ncbi:hypothetical protein ACQI4E_32250 [Streptomyces sp. CA-252508]|uniref:hypothetical protein n=1 Tax=Streptomyces sp. CA-252508 TaxID=3418946 RepID=UPI003D91A1A7